MSIHYLDHHDNETLNSEIQFESIKFSVKKNQATLIATDNNQFQFQKSNEITIKRTGFSLIRKNIFSLKKGISKKVMFFM